MLCSTNLIQKYLCDLSPTKIRLDQLYVRHRSFLLDLDTILWTVLLLLPIIKAYSPPEQLLIVGPVTRMIKRYISWYVWDSLILLFSVWITIILLRDIAPINISWSTMFPMFVAYLILYSFAAVKTGVNFTQWEKATTRDAVRLLVAWLIATAAVLVIHFVLGLTSELKRVVLLLSSIVFLMGILLARYRSRVLTGLLTRIMLRRTNSNVTGESVLVVGSGRTAEHILWLLAHPTYSAKYRVVGIIDDDLFSQGMNIYGVKVLGETKDIARIITEMDAGLVILADHRMAASNYRGLSEAVRNSLARIVVAPDIFGSMEGLNKFAPGNAEKDELDNFQCRHCLARRRF